MCYLVAKDRNAHGCFALKTTHGKHLDAWEASGRIKKRIEQRGWI